MKSEAIIKDQVGTECEGASGKPTRRYMLVEHASGYPWVEESPDPATSFECFESAKHAAIEDVESRLSDLEAEFEELGVGIANGQEPMLGCECRFRCAFCDADYATCRGSKHCSPFPMRQIGGMSQGDSWPPQLFRVR